MFIHFSDVFDVEPDVLEAFGAFDVSLASDLPMFVDPFLLFNSEKATYRRLHDGIIRYVRFLRDKSCAGPIDKGLLESWFTFREVKQNWLGYSSEGNAGHGLGNSFARHLSRNLRTVFSNFGNESISLGSHLEKLTLVRSGVGRDNISDFTTNLIKEFLLDYTQEFAKSNVPPGLRMHHAVRKVRFNYDTESWESREYDLPTFEGDFVLLTPKDMLTKDDTWISHGALVERFRGIVDSLPNAQLRAELDNYLQKKLSAVSQPSKEEFTAAVDAAVEAHPEVLDYFIREREEGGARARSIAAARVSKVERIFVTQLREFAEGKLEPGGFYGLDSHDEARERVAFLKHVIEDQDGWRALYDRDGEPIQVESMLQTLFKLVWIGSVFDLSPESSKGRGGVDFKVSRGSLDKTLVEFKLAKNTQLKRNLERQVQIYEAAESHPVAPKPSLKVIFYFDETQEVRVRKILAKLGLEADPNIVLIDARSDNKPPASRA